MAFGNYLKDVLKKTGRTAYSLAQETGIPKETLYAMIRKDSTPSLERIGLITGALGVPMSDYWEYMEAETSNNSINRFPAPVMSDSELKHLSQDQKEVIANQFEKDALYTLAKARELKILEHPEDLPEPQEPYPGFSKMLLNGLSALQMYELLAYSEFLRLKGKELKDIFPEEFEEQ